MPVYSIAVTIYGTAYVRADNAKDAFAKATALENALLEVSDAGSEGDDLRRETHRPGPAGDFTVAGDDRHRPSEGRQT